VHVSGSPVHEYFHNRAGWAFRPQGASVVCVSARIDLPFRRCAPALESMAFVASLLGSFVGISSFVCTQIFLIYCFVDYCILWCLRSGIYERSHCVGSNMKCFRSNIWLWRLLFPSHSHLVQILAYLDAKLVCSEPMDDIELPQHDRKRLSSMIFSKFRTTANDDKRSRLVSRFRDQLTLSFQTNWVNYNNTSRTWQYFSSVFVSDCGQARCSHNSRRRGHRVNLDSWYAAKLFAFVLIRDVCFWSFFQ
jgi:hypothetical protein